MSDPKLYDITLPGGKVARVREPTPHDVLDVGFMADRRILDRTVKMLDGKPRRVGDPLSLGQRDYLALWEVVRHTWIQPHPALEDVCEAQIEPGPEPGQLWIPLPSGIVKRDDESVATLFVLLQETDAGTYNEHMQTVNGPTTEARASQVDAAGLRMTKLAVKAERRDGVVKPLSALDLAVWPYGLPDLWVLRLAWVQMVTPREEDVATSMGSVRLV